jgi:hypothetical protein
MLQSEAGYIDARPLTANSTKFSCNARPDHTLGHDHKRLNFNLPFENGRRDGRRDGQVAEYAITSAQWCSPA